MRANVSALAWLLQTRMASWSSPAHARYSQMQHHRFWDFYFIILQTTRSRIKCVKRLWDAPVWVGFCDWMDRQAPRANQVATARSSTTPTLSVAVNFNCGGGGDVDNTIPPWPPPTPPKGENAFPRYTCFSRHRSHPNFNADTYLMERFHF